MQLEKLIALNPSEQPWWFRCWAAPLAILYRVCVAARNLAFSKGLKSSRKLPAYCVSVGNITLGGTGKSPVVLALLQAFKAVGEKPAVLSRGYASGLKNKESLVFFEGKQLFAPDLASDLASDLAPDRPIFADEARMQAQAFASVPFIVGSRRFEAACRFLAKNIYKPSVYLLDDGFQHRSIKRDLDIVLVDAQRPFGNEALLPQGTLRENPRQALARADLIFLTRCETGKNIEAVEKRLQGLSKGAVYRLSFQQTWPVGLNSVQAPFASEHQPVLVVTGIGSPEQFLQGLTQQKISVGASLSYRDHQRLDRGQILNQMGSCKSVLTSAKDYWRDPSVFANVTVPVFIVPLVVSIPDAALAHIIDSKGLQQASEDHSDYG